jgi:hypothetical protein
MKIRLILAMSSALLVGFGPSPARAGGGLAGSGDPFTAFFDENGNGSYDPRDGTGMKQLLTVAGAANLIYILPSPVITGDVRIWEDFVGGTLSDVLRFTNANGDLDGGLNGTLMIVYSDLPEPGEKGDKADVGIPAQLTPRDGGGLLEIGPEGNNGVIYAPGGPFDNIYNFRSDVTVPEPSSIIMLSLGALGATGYGWRRHRARVA